MPRYDMECQNGHIEEHLFSTWAQSEDTVMVCATCGHPMHKIFTPGKGLVWFEESRPRTFVNLDVGNGPVTCTTAKQHREAMKAAGVTNATKDDMLHQQTRKALDARRPEKETLWQTRT